MKHFMVLALVCMGLQATAQMDWVEYNEKLGNQSIHVKAFQCKKDYVYYNDGLYRIENDSLHVYEINYVSGSASSLSLKRAFIEDLNLKKAEITNLGEYGYLLVIPAKKVKDVVQVDSYTPLFPANTEYHWQIKVPCESSKNASKILSELRAIAEK